MTWTLHSEIVSPEKIPKSKSQIVLKYSFYSIKDQMTALYKFFYTVYIFIVYFNSRFWTRFDTIKKHTSLRSKILAWPHCTYFVYSLYFYCLFQFNTLNKVWRNKQHSLGGASVNTKCSFWRAFVAQTTKRTSNKKPQLNGIIRPYCWIFISARNQSQLHSNRKWHEQTSHYSPRKFNLFLKIFRQR